MSEAQKLIAKQVKNGRIKQDKADAVLASIEPQLDYAGFDQVDAVVEAVVENIKIKHAVLSEVESLVRTETVIASNTSSLCIDDLAARLKRLENFVGMHFFNPVANHSLGNPTTAERDRYSRLPLALCTTPLSRALIVVAFSCTISSVFFKT